MMLLSLMAQEDLGSLEAAHSLLLQAFIGMLLVSRKMREPAFCICKNKASDDWCASTNR